MKTMRFVRVASLLLGSLLSVSQAADEPPAPTVSNESVRPTTTPHGIERARMPVLKPVETKARSYPLDITPYDYMTPEDEFFFHHLEKLCQGSDIANWPLVKQMLELGLDGLDAGIIAGMANETIYINDQPRAAPIMQIVKECAEALQIEPPPVHIKGTPIPNAWVTGFRAPHVLVLTSGLLQLYQDSPEELRFIIGHELGHLKSRHLRTRFVGQILLGALLREKLLQEKLTDKAIVMVSMAALLQWIREAEYSADRAGLICVGGDVEVAKQSLLRLLHQTMASNKLMDSKHRNFDSTLAVQHSLNLRERPLVETISWLKQISITHPFVPDRCMQLDEWAQSTHYRDLLRRPKTPHSKSSVVITKIKVTGIPKTDTYVPFVDGKEADPLVTLSHAGKILQTSYLSDRTEAEWTGIELRFPFNLGAGLIVELHDYNTVTSNSLIGSVRLPVDPFAERSGVVKADLRMDILAKSTIVERPIVTVEYRLDDHE